jgi:AcrR family transcriptional regulator
MAPSPSTRARPQPRDRLLAAALDYVVAHGFADLSLRELAAAIGTSHRMLIYHFGSKQGLLVAIVQAVEAAQRDFVSTLVADPRLAPADVSRRLWRRLADPSLWPHERLFFEVYAQALQGRPGTTGLLAGIVDTWVDLAAAYAMRRGVPSSVARADARLGVAVYRGLLLDLLATGDRRGVDAAFERYISHMEAGSDGAGTRPAPRPRGGRMTKDARNRDRPPAAERDARYTEQMAERSDWPIGDSDAGSGTPRSSDDIGSSGSAGAAGGRGLGDTSHLHPGQAGAAGGGVGTPRQHGAPRSGAADMPQTERGDAGADRPASTAADRGAVDRAKRRIDLDAGGGLNNAADQAAGVAGTPAADEPGRPGAADLGAAAGPDLGAGLGATRGSGGQHPRGQITGSGGTRGSGPGTGHLDQTVG